MKGPTERWRRPELKESDEDDLNRAKFADMHTEL